LYVHADTNATVKTLAQGVYKSN